MIPAHARLVGLALLCACTADPGPTTPGGEPLPGDPDYVRDERLNVDLQSEAGATESHETGAACMHCHQPHGDGLGLFSAAGSAYRSDGTPATTGSIQLWALDGELLVELPIDGLGNFYTTLDLGLPDMPVIPLVLDEGGELVNQMPWPTESASCNQCHTPIRRVLVP